MESNAETACAFSEEEKLPEGMDEDTSWFGKNLEEESDNTAEHEVLNPEMSQNELGVELTNAKDSNSMNDKTEAKSPEEIMETDSQSELLDEISNDTLENRQVILEQKDDDLSKLKDIDIGSKKHDISNELKEMFEEKSSDAEELHETSLTKHSLDTDITKEDKLKDIVPDDILGKDDSFDELDNEELHQEIEAHLTYDKNKDLIDDLPDTNTLPETNTVLPNEQATSQTQDNTQISGQSEPVINKSLEDLNFTDKGELLTNLTENIGTKEIDDIIEQGMPSEDDSNNSKDISSDLKEMSSSLNNCVSELKDDLESELQNITGESTEELKSQEESTIHEESLNQVDKSSIELNQENMMVEFAHDNGNQVLIQINTEQRDQAIENTQKTEGIVMETSDGQTLVFSSSDVTDCTPSDTDIVSQVEGGADFLHAVTGKLEDVLMPVKQETEDGENTQPPNSTLPSQQVVATEDKKEVVKEDSPKCCISSCKSGKSTLRTTFRYFKPPVNKILYKKWEYIFNQAKQTLTPDSLICELHFRTGLIYKRGMDKTGKILWALREGALPKLSPSGILRMSPAVPSPSTTVQVPKKPETVTNKSLSYRPIAPKPAVAKISSPVTTTTAPVTPSAPKVLTKKILQKPVKTVATKVSNEITDIGFLYKNPELVKVAQDEIANLDVLVCGECHSVFHILELFQAHKMANNCKGESNFKGNPSEPKPQVWAFLLWKSAQAKVSDVESSWKLYQRWCKMDERIRNTWVAAGKSLQEGNAISSLKMLDVSPRVNKVGRPPLKNKDSDDEDFHVRRAQKRPKFGHKTDISLSEAEIEADLGGAGDATSYSESEPMEVENRHVSPAKPIENAHDVDQMLDNLSRHTPELITSEVEIKQEVMSDDDHEENKENESRRNKQSDEIHNCTRCKEPITNLKEAILCAAGCYGFFHVECTRIKSSSNLSKMGSKKKYWKCDTCKVNDTPRPADKDQLPQKYGAAQKPQSATQKAQETKEDEEFVVEKIVSRRYNIKKKHFEYLLKWEGYPSEQNTWEPAENLGTCQHLLKAFEEALAKQQAAKQAANKQVGASITKPDNTYKVKPPVITKRKPELNTPGPSTTSFTATGRPVRSSKQKAMDQVKVWCGSIVRPSDDDNVGIKRKASSDSEYEEEVVVKRVKVEVESEDSDSESVKKLEKFTPSRGRGRPPGSTNSARGQAQSFINKPVVNGTQKDSNLAAALGLESDEEDNNFKASPQKTPLVRKISSLSPQNQQVLVASAKGVVTVDPKQVPNLSSGVYIMSNKSGIIKVDNNKTLNSLQKSGVLKKPITLKTDSTPTSSPQKSGSGVVVLSKAEATSQQKIGVIRKDPTPKTTTSTPTVTSVTTSASTTTTTTPRPPGLLKPMRPGATPRPLGLLKPTGSTSTPTSTSPSVTTTPAIPPRPPSAQSSLSPSAQTLRPKQQIPLQGRPAASPLIRKPLPESPILQATPQQKLLIAKKKAESEGNEVKPITMSSPKKMLGSPSSSGDEAKIPLIKPKIEAGLATPTLPPIKSTNKVLAHPLLSRGRGRGGFRGRGRGSSLSHLLQVTQREPEPIKDSKLVESDNLLMEFQEPSESEESDDGLEDIFPNLSELPPIEPDSPPRPLTLCPLTGKVLCKAEGEKTPEPTPPPSPKPPTPPPEEPTHILPDHEDEVETEVSAPVPTPPPVTVTTIPSRKATPTTAVVKQDGMICKVEMSPGGTTGTLVEAVSAVSATPPGVTEGTVTIKKPLASRNRLNRGPQLSVMPPTSSTSLGTITVPARKLFQEENGDDDMVTITGEDGLVYQVSNSELTGNTLLVSSGEDGQQQCVYVTTDADGGEEGSTILTLDTAYADAVAQLGSDQVNILSTENGDQFYIKEGDDGSQLMTLEGEEGLVAGDDQSGQVVAQLVEAGEPAPGGSRRVVLLLPDGNLMMTEVDEEQYAALDLDK